MKIGILKALAFRRLEGKSKYIHIDKDEIASIVDRFLHQTCKNIIVLFYPSKEYWVSLTDVSIVFFQNNEVHIIDYNDIINEHFYNRVLGEIQIDSAKFIYDELVLETKAKETFRLQIEVSGIYSFCSVVGKMVVKGNSL